MIQFTPDPFPLSDDRRLIAPFWADVDNTVAGEIYFREDRSPEIIQLVNQNIQRAFSVDFGRFVSSWVFIATWDMVAFYNNRQKQLKVKYSVKPCNSVWWKTENFLISLKPNIILGCTVFETCAQHDIVLDVYLLDEIWICKNVGYFVEFFYCKTKIVFFIFFITDLF